MLSCVTSAFAVSTSVTAVNVRTLTGNGVSTRGAANYFCTTGNRNCNDNNRWYYGEVANSLEFDLDARKPRTAADQMYYHGGALFSGMPTVVPIFYGTWSTAQVSIINDWGSSFGTSNGYIEIIGSTYSNQAGLSSFTYASPYSVTSYPAGSTTYTTLLTDIDLAKIVLQATGGVVQSNTLYSILTSADVQQAISSTESFCNQYCGYHSNAATAAGQTFEYAFIGNPVACGNVAVCAGM